MKSLSFCSLNEYLTTFCNNMFQKKLILELTSIQRLSTGKERKHKHEISFFEFQNSDCLVCGKLVYMLDYGFKVYGPAGALSAAVMHATLELAANACTLCCVINKKQ